eukprot:359586-Chlamydomonas_euryale.AAC.24
MATKHSRRAGARGARDGPDGRVDRPRDARRSQRGHTAAHQAIGRARRTASIELPLAPVQLPLNARTPHPFTPAYLLEGVYQNRARGLTKVFMTAHATGTHQTAGISSQHSR